jgi:hypothetical protein
MFPETQNKGNSMKWKKLESANRPVRLTKGVEVIGRLVSVQTVKTKYGERRVYVFDNAKNEVRVWSNAALDNVLLDAKGKLRFAGSLMRLVGGPKIKIPGRSQPMQSVDIYIAEKS